MIINIQKSHVGPYPEWIGVALEPRSGRRTRGAAGAASRLREFAQALERGHRVPRRAIAWALAPAQPPARLDRPPPRLRRRNTRPHRDIQRTDAHGRPRPAGRDCPKLSHRRRRRDTFMGRFSAAGTGAGGTRKVRAPDKT